MVIGGPTIIYNDELIENAYISIKINSIYDRTINEWDERTVESITWIQFKKDFISAYIGEQKNKGRQRYNKLKLNVVTKQFMKQLSVLTKTTTTDKQAVTKLISAKDSLVSKNVEITTKLNQALERDIKNATEHWFHKRFFKEK